MATAKVRCSAIKCKGWDVDGQGLCAKHRKQDKDTNGAMTPFLLATPLPGMDTMLVAQAIDSPHYLKAKEGEIVEVLKILSDGVSVIVRNSEGTVGNYNLNFLLTSEQVLAAHAEQERAAKAEQDRQRREIEAKQQEEEERQRLQNMLNLAKNDTKERQQQFEEAQRRLEEAKRLPELMKQREEEERKRKLQEAKERREAADRERIERLQREREFVEQQKRAQEQEQAEKSRVTSRQKSNPSIASPAAKSSPTTTTKSPQKATTSPTKAATPSKRFATALYDYAGTEIPNSLHFFCGNKIELLDVDPQVIASGWMLGRLGTREGLFPASYVQEQ